MNDQMYVREDLKGFNPYQAPYITEGIKLDANENPYPMDEKIKEQIVLWLNGKQDFRIYPDSECNSLRSTIAKYYGVMKEEVVCGVGSDQLIDCMIRGVAMPGDVIVYPNPSFSMYASVIALNHAKGIPVELNSDFSYPIEEMIEACNENKAKLLILCTPNNPTGNGLPLEDIRSLAKGVNCPVLVDEAYGEFTNESAISLVSEFDNVVVFRTFSKAYGLAGLRIGYAIGSQKALYPMMMTKPPYNVSTFTQVVAQIVMENAPVYKEQIREIQKERELLKDKLEKFRMRVYPSEANFLLIECDEISLDEYLQNKGIYIRSMNIKGKKMYRITIGTKEQNQMLLQCIGEAN